MGKINLNICCFLLILNIVNCCKAAKNNLSYKNQTFINKHSLPEGRMKEILDKAFSQTRDPLEAFKDPSFTILKNSHNRIVATYQDEDFVIKTRNINENKFLNLLLGFGLKVFLKIFLTIFGRLFTIFVAGVYLPFIIADSTSGENSFLNGLSPVSIS